MNKDTTGLFITFEGTEGAGKTTIITKVAQYLEDMNYKVVVTREPGGVALSEKIRTLLFETENMDERTEALLFAAARREHLIRKIQPALKTGAIVLCDRYVDSSLAYQGFARGLGMDKILSLNLFAVEDYLPNCTFYLSLPVEVGLQRIKQAHNREINRLDNEELLFHKQVQEAYEQLSQKYHERYVKIDAEQDISKIVEQVCHVIQTKLQ